MTNTGTEKPSTDSAITKRSIQPPARAAASTPSGTASPTATISVHSVSASVGSMRWPISVDTGSWVKIDVPRSPRARSASQPPKRTR